MSAGASPSAIPCRLCLRRAHSSKGVGGRGHGGNGRATHLAFIATSNAVTPSPQRFAAWRILYAATGGRALHTPWEPAGSRSSASPRIA